MKFDLASFDGSQETVDKIKSRRKWKATCLDVVSKDYLFRELSFQLKDNQEAKIFCFLLYLTSARRCEVLNLKRQDVSRSSIRMQNGIAHEVLVFQMMNQKNKQTDRKYIPLVKGLDLIEDAMISEVEAYIFSKDDFIFKRVGSTAWNKVLEKVKLKTRYKERWMPITEEMIVEFGLFPHYLRHCRLTHMNWLSPVLITQLAGWSNSQLQGKFGASGKLIDTYLHKNWETLAKEMILHGL